MNFCRQNMIKTNNPINSPTISIDLRDRLIESIVSGDIAPGSKLSEPKLAQQFNISRGPLREAIRQLEGLNLVYHVPHLCHREKSHVWRNAKIHRSSSLIKIYTRSPYLMAQLRHLKRKEDLVGPKN